MQKQPFSIPTRGFEKQFFILFFTLIRTHFFTSTERTVFHSIEKKTKQQISIKKKKIQDLLEELLDLDFEVGMYMYCRNIKIILEYHILYYYVYV